MRRSQLIFYLFLYLMFLKVFSISIIFFISSNKLLSIVNHTVIEITV